MMEHEYLLPSEIARLVYGHLKIQNCHKLAEKFLNSSPHLEECRQEVKRNKTFKFETKAFSLSLEDILKQYISLRDLILNIANSSIASTSQQYTDPTTALEFLLSTNDLSYDDKDLNTCIIFDEEGSNDRSTGANMISDTLLKHNNENEETSSNINLYIETTPEKMVEVREHSLGLHLSNDSDSVGVSCDEEACLTQKQRSLSSSNDFFKFRRKNCLLDDLYASTESLDNPTKKKTVKILKPRLTSNRSFNVPTNSVTCENSNAGNITPNESFSSEIVMPTDKKEISFPASKLTVSEGSSNLSTRQLRSSRRTKEDVSLVSGSKTSKYSRNKKNRTFDSVTNDTPTRRTRKYMNPVQECEAVVEFSGISEMMIENPKWPELISENINETVSDSPQKKIQSIVDNTDSIIEKITEKTSSNICDEFTRSLISCSQNQNQKECEEETTTNVIIENNSDGTIMMQNDQLTESAEHNFEIPSENEENSKLLESERLQENINEFIRFNNQPSNHINSNESNVILIQVPPKSDTLTDNDHFFNETHNHILNSNYVVCTADELPMQSKSKIVEQDEIINLCEGNSEVPWDITSGTMLPTETETITSINPENSIKSKMQLYGSLISLSSKSKQSNTYRPIAPKPDSTGLILELQNDENIIVKSQTKRKTTKRLKK